MKHIITFLIILFFYEVEAQQIFKGKIVEKNNNNPIAGAVISCDSLSIGTISNSTGEFEMKINASHPTLRVRIIGYKSFEYKAEPLFIKTISLDELIVSIDEVSVTNDDYATKLVRLANQKAEEDTSIYNYSKGFYQRILKRNDEIAIIHEFFFDAAISSYGIPLWNITNARYATNNDSTLVKMSNPTRLATLLSANLIRTNNGSKCTFPNTIEGYDKFRFKIIGYLNKNDSNEIAIINCKPKKKQIPYFEGDIYIFTKNPRIVRLKGEANIMSLGIKALFVNHSLTMDICFEENNKHEMYLRNASYCFNLKYPKSIFKRERTKDDFSVLLYQTNLPKIKNLKDSFNHNDDDFVKTTTYNPSFWINNEILKRDTVTQTAIDSFDKKKYFGNYGRQ